MMQLEGGERMARLKPVLIIVVVLAVLCTVVFAAVHNDSAEPKKETTITVTPKPSVKPTVEPTVEPTATPAVTPTAEPTETTEPSTETSTGSDKVSGDYVVNTGTGKFHDLSCSSVGKIKAENRMDYSGSRDELISRGYAPCKRCNP